MHFSLKVAHLTLPTNQDSLRGVDELWRRWSNFHALFYRLREIIIAAKPNLISLQYVIAPGFIDQTFLTRYSESVPLPAFMSFMSAVSRLTFFWKKIVHIQSFRVDPNFTAAISRFRSLVMCHQMIASDGLLVALTVHFFVKATTMYSLGARKGEEARPITSSLTDFKSLFEQSSVASYTCGT